MLDIKVASIKGWEPIDFYSLIGKTLKRNYDFDESIMPDDVL